MQTPLGRAAVLIAVLALGGVVVSGISLANHYAEDDASSFCAVDETFDCDLVNKSIYARVLGIPVALIGLIGYALLLLLAFVRNRLAHMLLFIATLAGLAFSLYLTYIEAFVLGVYCILCLISLGLIAAISVLAGVRSRRAPTARAA